MLLSSHRHCRSAKRNLLHVPRHRLNMYGHPPGFCHCWSVRLEQSSTIQTPSRLLSGACSRLSCWYVTSTEHIGGGRFPEMCYTKLYIDIDTGYMMICKENKFVVSIICEKYSKCRKKLASDNCSVWFENHSMQIDHSTKCPVHQLTDHELDCSQIVRQILFPTGSISLLC